MIVGRLLMDGEGGADGLEERVDGWMKGPNRQAERGKWKCMWGGASAPTYLMSTASNAPGGGEWCG